MKIFLISNSEFERTPKGAGDATSQIHYYRRGVTTLQIHHVLHKELFNIIFSKLYDLFHYILFISICNAYA